MSALDEMIRKRAYELWEKAGMPQGRSDEFWFAARAEFESGAPPAEKREADAPVPPPKASPSAAGRQRERRGPARRKAENKKDLTVRCRSRQICGAQEAGLAAPVVSSSRRATIAESVALKSSVTPRCATDESKNGLERLPPSATGGP